ncbi:CAP Gly-rich domain-containing protein [Dioscorea alata]|uniref:CAP Gly-rich domain-containing protein n=1 Tax=Dioscorea alata TaxID=55571 RepID=A0ACB7VQV9_DIOAL|nr:CAP Gly-rich domain-containing protein [Dioscorea alata]
METNKALKASPPPPPSSPPPSPPPPCPCHQKESVFMEVMGDSEMDSLPQTCQYCMQRMMGVEVEEDAESCCGKFEGERVFDCEDFDDVVVVVDDDDDGFRQFWRSWRQDGVVLNTAEEDRLFWLSCLADHGFP